MFDLDEKLSHLHFAQLQGTLSLLYVVANTLKHNKYSYVHGCLRANTFVTSVKVQHQHLENSMVMKTTPQNHIFKGKKKIHCVALNMMYKTLRGFKDESSICTSQYQRLSDEGFFGSDLYQPAAVYHDLTHGNL